MPKANRSRKRAPARPSHRGRAAWLVVVAGAVALLIFRHERRDAKPPAPVAAAEPHVAAPLAPPSLPSQDTDLPPGDMNGNAGADHVRRALADYKDFAMFPPWSRPVDEAQQHVVEWNPKIHEGRVFDRDKQGHDLSADVTLDRMFAGPGQSLTATAKVWKDVDGKQQPADFKITGKLQVFDPSHTGGGGATVGDEPGWSNVSDVAFGPGNPRTATFTPSAIPALAKSAKQVRLIVRIDAADHPAPFELAFRYAAAAPVVVLGKQSDAIVDGSLQVNLDVDVKVVTPIEVSAALYAADGKTAICMYDDYKRPEQTGHQTFTLTFFGRCIHRAGANGPYVVGALHGLARPDADGPEQFWSHAQQYATATYAASDFSDAEWQSHEKDLKIQQYEETIAKFEHGQL